MTNDVFKYFDESYNEFNPELLENYKSLKLNIKEQKDENVNLLKQIDFLNTEIKTIFENIIKLDARLETIEKCCGCDNQGQQVEFDRKYIDENEEMNTEEDELNDESNSN